MQKKITTTLTLMTKRERNHEEREKTKKEITGETSGWKEMEKMNEGNKKGERENHHQKTRADQSI